MKVFGIGLNKTATKSLNHCFRALGFRNQSFSLDAYNYYRENNLQDIFRIADQFDSFDDWPWPLIYQQLDAHYPEAKFVLTVRESADIWYQSLCKMAVRMGPLNDFEKHIYGYAMPHGHKDEHVRIYDQHNAEVRSYFANKPGKLLELCFDNGVSMDTITDFLDLPRSDYTPPHINKSLPVYAGDNLALAQINRVAFQTKWKIKRRLQRVFNSPE